MMEIPFLIFTLFACLGPMGGTFVEILPIRDVSNCAQDRTCYTSSKSYRGIRPMGIEELGQCPGDNCNYLYDCRRQGNEEHPMIAIRFNCSDADPNKPFFDINTCQCVASNATCPDLDRKQLNCLAEFLPEDKDETCRNFGPEPDTNKIYYLNKFPDLEDPTKFWYCEISNISGSAEAESYSCSNSTNPEVIWNSQLCGCETITNATLREEILQLNSHPANRFTCATMLNETTIISERVCQDHVNRHYKGKVANQGTYQNVYFECVEDETTGSTTPIAKNCPPNQMFDILSCGCNANLDFDPKENFNPEYFKICANLAEEETCKDEEGLFHIGVLPHQKDCSKFWQCGENGVASVQDCSGDLLFDVTSEFCGCDYPDNVKCENNLKPENKFRCANATIGLF